MLFFGVKYSFLDLDLNLIAEIRSKRHYDLDHYIVYNGKFYKIIQIIHGYNGTTGLVLNLEKEYGE